MQGQERWSLSIRFTLGLDKKLEIFKTLINCNTNLITTCTCNFKTLIFTCISILYCEANACIRHFSLLEHFMRSCRGTDSHAILALVWKQLNKWQSLLFLNLTIGYGPGWRYWFNYFSIHSTLRLAKRNIYNCLRQNDSTPHESLSCLGLEMKSWSFVYISGDDSVFRSDTQIPQVAP